MASVPTHYLRNAKANRLTYKRACDICSHNWPFFKLRPIGQGRWACPDDYKGLTAEQLARMQSRMRPLVVRPRRHARVSDVVATYQNAEAPWFNLLTQFGPTAATVALSGTIVSALTPATVTSLTYSGMYVARVLDENLRPHAWMATARTALRSIADSLLAMQYGSPFGPSPSTTVDLLNYGGVAQGSTMITVFGARACMIWLAAARHLGDLKYTEAALRAGHFLRNTQRADRLAAAFTTLLGARYYYGGFINSMNVPFTNVISFAMNAEDAVSVQALAELRDLLGGDYRLGATTASGDFATAPVGTIDEALEEARAFYIDGGTFGGETVKAMFSSTFVADQFVWTAFPPTWSVTAGAGMALGLGALFSAYGWETVRPVFEFLMSYGANPANATPAGTTPAEERLLLTGDYDPEIGFATSITNTVPLTESTGTTYSISGTAALAPLYAASGRSLRTFKDACAIARTRRTRNPDLMASDSPIACGLGLSFQNGLSAAATASNMVAYSVTQRALNAMIFRIDPAAFNGRGIE